MQNLADRLDRPGAVSEARYGPEGTGQRLERICALTLKARTRPLMDQHLLIASNVFWILTPNTSELKRLVNFGSRLLGPPVPRTPITQERHRKMTYAMDLPTAVLAFRDNHPAAVTIPAGGIVELSGPAEDDRFSAVSVNDEQFHMFASDLADRGKQIEAVANAENVIEPNEKALAHGTRSSERGRDKPKCPERPEHA
jgi:hypothetical protein